MAAPRMSTEQEIEALDALCQRMAGFEEGVSLEWLDGYMTALEALKAADSGERDDIADVVADVTYTGVTGAIAFDENGDALRDQAFIKAADPSTGTWTFVKVQGIEGN